MDKLITLARFLLGLAYAFFGANHLFHFMAPPEPVVPEAGAFLGALTETGYMWTLVGLAQLIGGLMMFSRNMAPMGLILLAPISINILFFHLMLDPAFERAWMGYLLCALNVVLGLYYSGRYAAMFRTERR
jgi:putative oxidoreductase